MNTPGREMMQAETLQAVLRLAEACEYEAQHAQHVTRLALRLFDELTMLHDLGPRERFWLECAGLLHDIGWVEGWKGHHKTSLRIILNTPMLPFGNKERLIIGSVARYHRKGLPNEKHDHFEALTPEEQDTARALAALLRTADGLDRSHQSRVLDLACKVRSKRILVRAAAVDDIQGELDAAHVKSDLMEQVFKRRIVFESHSPD